MSGQSRPIQTLRLLGVWRETRRRPARCVRLGLALETGGFKLVFELVVGWMFILWVTAELFGTESLRFAGRFGLFAVAVTLIAVIGSSWVYLTIVLFVVALVVGLSGRPFPTARGESRRAQRSREAQRLRSGSRRRLNLPATCQLESGERARSSEASRSPWVNP